MRYELALKGWCSIGYAAAQAARRAEGSVAMVDEAMHGVALDGTADRGIALAAARSALENELALLRMVELWCSTMAEGGESSTRSQHGDGSSSFRAA